MPRTVAAKNTSPAVLESRAVMQQGVQRLPAPAPGGTAAATDCSTGSVIQNKVPAAEAKRHAAMGGPARRRAMVAAGSGGQVDADGDYDGDKAVPKG